ncbi:hypothetical protein HZ994_13565 [Akkermansiaceae bacterium]|nr:hypothetical protein HZ994_13565 [Akkermansiaceae bacterium]
MDESKFLYAWVAEIIEREISKPSQKSPAKTRMHAFSGDGAVVQWQQAEGGTMAFAGVITLSEIRYGASMLIASDPGFAARLGEWYREILIAATAKVHGLTVATRNVTDFEKTGRRLFNPWGYGA